MNIRIAQQYKEINHLKQINETQENTLSNFEDCVAVLSSAVDYLSSSTTYLKKAVDDQEQYSRGYCLRIHGIDIEENETAGKCVEKVVEDDSLSILLGYFQIYMVMVNLETLFVCQFCHKISIYLCHSHKKII